MILIILTQVIFIIPAMRTKAQIKEKLTEIQLERTAYDLKFDKLHGLLSEKNAMRMPVHRLREEFQRMVPELREIVRENKEELERQRGNCKLLQDEGNDMSSQVRTIDSLKEYFQELEQKVKSEQARGQEKLSERERWELTQNGEHDGLDE